MTDRHRLSDEEWERLLPILKNTPGIYLVFPARCRQFVEAVLWILRTGSPWRQLSASGLKWNSVFRRFSRWSKHGVWQALLNTLAQEADLQNICIDSSVIRAHACAAGARASCEDDEALGRSRGGFGTKVHMAVDGLGLPLRFILSGGQCADIRYAQPLVENIQTPMVLADKGYDADAFLTWLANNDIRAVIPPKINRKEPRDCDFVLYKERHVVECTFGKLKHYRRIATRYEKTACHYMEMLSFAAALLWLR
jgi:transposase